MRRRNLFLAAILAISITAAGCGGAGTDAAGGTVGASAAESAADTVEKETDAAGSGTGQGEAAAGEDAAGSGTDQGEAADGNTAEGLVTPIESLDLADMFSNRDQDSSYDVGSATEIVLNGTTAEVSGSGAAAEGQVVTISAEGTYIVSGRLTDGQIIVDADESAKIQIVMDGVDITNDDGPCLLVRAADKVFLTLAEGTTNTLSDTGAEYVQESDEYEIDAVIFSREDLTLNGTGELVVNANYKHAIVSKDDLVITEGTYVLTAKGKGLTGKDSVRIQDGTITVSAEDDAIHSGNGEDTGKGFVYIEGGIITLSSGDDGIHAATALVIAGGTIDVTESYEGFEGASIDIMDGVIDITARDDGMNASVSDSNADSGRFSRPEEGSSGGMRGSQNAEADGGMRGSQNAGADGDMREAFSGNTDGQRPGTPPEGMNDGMNSETDGDMREAFSGNADGQRPGTPPEGMNDGMNSETDGDMRKAFPGNADGQRPDTPPEGINGGMNRGMMDAQPDAYLRISGGTITVNADGDGLDSNGMLYVDGGTVTVYGPTNNGNGALDYGTGATITGGTVIAAGSAGMAETFGEDSTQYSILYNFGTTVAGGTELSLTDEDGSVIVTVSPGKDYQSVVLSSPELKEGTYTIRAGSYEGTVEVSGIVTTSGSNVSAPGQSGAAAGGNVPAAGVVKQEKTV